MLLFNAYVRFRNKVNDRVEYMLFERLSIDWKYGIIEAKIEGMSFLRVPIENWMEMEVISSGIR